jgi:hypothetical protein
MLSRHPNPALVGVDRRRPRTLAKNMRGFLSGRKSAANAGSSLLAANFCMELAGLETGDHLGAI